MVGPIVRDTELLSGLENQNDEGESMHICESAPKCRGGKGALKRG